MFRPGVTRTRTQAKRMRITKRNRTLCEPAIRGEPQRYLIQGMWISLEGLRIFGYI
jgi:hypothetical protein